MRTLDDCLRIVGCDGPWPLNDVGIIADIVGYCRGKLVSRFVVVTADDGSGELRVFYTDGTHDNFPSTSQWPDRSIEAVIKLVPADWWWTVGLYNLTGHASIGPDYNGPARDRLLAEFQPEVFDGTINEDLRPGDGMHRVCQAMLVCILTAQKMMQEQKQ